MQGTRQRTIKIYHNKPIIQDYTKYPQRVPNKAIHKVPQKVPHSTPQGTKQSNIQSTTKDPPQYPTTANKAPLSVPRKETEIDYLA